MNRQPSNFEDINREYTKGDKCLKYLIARESVYGKNTGESSVFFLYGSLYKKIFATFSIVKPFKI